MNLSTRQKIMLARVAYSVVMAARRLGGRSHEAHVRRADVSWCLDLREGIDFAIYLTGAFEPATVAAYRRLIRPGDVVIDVGANMGAHTLHLARAVGERGCVLAYEPAARAFARLARNIEHNPALAARIHARQVMLGDGVAAPLESAVYASWPLVRTPGAHHLHLGIALSTDGAQQLTLDQAVADAAVDHVALIKLDVDGHELQVLRGSRDTLRRSRPTVILELAPYTLEERGDDPAELIAFFVERQYTFFDLSGKRLAPSGASLPIIAPGSSLNVIARCSPS
jgi:FkbM family methyltransferase